MASKRNSEDKMTALRRRYGDLSPKEIEIFGKAERKFQIRQGAAGGGAFFVMGLFLIVLCAALWDTDLVILLVFGIVFLLAGAIYGVCYCLHYRRMTMDELAVRYLSRVSSRNRFLAYGMQGNLSPQGDSESPLGEREDPGRKIDSEFYLGWDELQNLGFHPQAFENGWRYKDDWPVDVLADEEGGRLAVCSYFEEKICGVFDMKKIIGCELQRNGDIVRHCEVDDPRSFEPGFGMNTDDVYGGDANGSGNAIDEFRVVALYDDLSEIDIAFDFDDHRDIAERLYRMFSIVVRRNGRAKEAATGDSLAE